MESHGDLRTFIASMIALTSVTITARGIYNPFNHHHHRSIELHDSPPSDGHGSFHPSPPLLDEGLQMTSCYSKLLPGELPPTPPPRPLHHGDRQCQIQKREQHQRLPQERWRKETLADRKREGRCEGSVRS
jgi:hypothetical protein